MNTDIVRQSVPKSKIVTKLHGMFSDDIVSLIGDKKYRRNKRRVEITKKVYQKVCSKSSLHF
jgi:hypothetical protein